jgi:hypothetical protein
MLPATTDNGGGRRQFREFDGADTLSNLPHCRPILGVITRESG